MSPIINPIFAQQKQYSINSICQKCESIMLYNRNRVCVKCKSNEKVIENENVNNKINTIIMNNEINQKNNETITYNINKLGQIQQIKTPQLFKIFFINLHSIGPDSFKKMS